MAGVARFLRPAGARRAAERVTPLFNVGHESVQLPLACEVLLQALDSGDAAATKYWGQLNESQRMAVMRRAAQLPEAVKQNRLNMRRLRQPTEAEMAAWQQLPQEERMQLPKPRHHQAAVGHPPVAAAATMRQLPRGAATGHQSLVKQVGRARAGVVAQVDETAAVCARFAVACPTLQALRWL